MRAPSNPQAATPLPHCPLPGTLARGAAPSALPGAHLGECCPHLPGTHESGKFLPHTYPLPGFSGGVLSHYPLPGTRRGARLSHCPCPALTARGCCPLRHHPALTAGCCPRSALPSTRVLPYLPALTGCCLPPAQHSQRGTVSTTYPTLTAGVLAAYTPAQLLATGVLSPLRPARHSEGVLLPSAAGTHRGCCPTPCPALTAGCPSPRSGGAHPRHMHSPPLPGCSSRVLGRGRGPRRLREGKEEASSSEAGEAERAQDRR